MRGTPFGVRDRMAAPHRAPARTARRRLREVRSRGAADHPARPHAAIPRDALGVFAAARLVLALAPLVLLAVVLMLASPPNGR